MRPVRGMVLAEPGPVSSGGAEQARHGLAKLSEEPESLAMLAVSGWTSGGRSMVVRILKV